MFNIRRRKKNIKKEVPKKVYDWVNVAEHIRNTCKNIEDGTDCSLCYYYKVCSAMFRTNKSPEELTLVEIELILKDIKEQNIDKFCKILDIYAKSQKKKN